MKRLRVKVAAGIVSAGVLGFGAVAVAGGHGINEKLTGYAEVPALSTPGVGRFEASINKAGNEIRYELGFSGLESAATQAHIHFENHTNNGPIVVFLCSNLGNGPEGTQPCPAGGGTISGTITAKDVSPAAVGPTAPAAGIAAGEFDELVRAIRAGATYVNVHSVNRAGGEIRAQLGDNSKRSNDHDH